VQAQDGATCAGDVTPGVQVTKNCNALLNNNTEVPGYVVLEVRVTGTVTNTGNVALTNVSVIDQDIGELNPLLTGVSLAPGGSQNYEASYFPGNVGQSTACGVAFADTVAASGTGALGSGTVDYQTNGDPATATANCPLCPAVCGDQ